MITLDAFEKIAVTISIIGVVGIIINMITARDVTKLKYHLYSSVPGFGGVIMIILYAIWK